MIVYIIMVLWCVIGDGFYYPGTVVCFGDGLYYPVLWCVIGDGLYDHDTVECISDSFYGVLFVVYFTLVVSCVIGYFISLWYRGVFLVMFYKY